AVPPLGSMTFKVISAVPAFKPSSLTSTERLPGVDVVGVCVTLTTVGSLLPGVNRVRISPSGSVIVNEKVRGEPITTVTWPLTQPPRVGNTGGRFSSTWAVPLLLGSAVLTALTVIVPLGTVPGGVYSPVVEMVPTIALPPTTLLTCQVTAVLSPPVACTVAVN